VSRELCVAARGDGAGARATATPLLASRAALVAARPGAGTDLERCAAARAGLRVSIPDGREAADLAARIATIPHCDGDTE
jgi:hypothetical protein